VTGASGQLLRLLRLIPLASRPEGLRVSDAARLCGVTEAVIDADFRVLADRAWYLPPGSTDDFQILLEADRVHVVAPPAFARPVRLGLHEMLAVSLALRCAGLDGDEARALARAIEEACAFQMKRDADPGIRGMRGGEPGEGSGEGPGEGPSEPTDEPVAFLLRRRDSDELHDQVSRALVERHRIEAGYLKEGAEAPETRRLEPWRLLHAEGESYLLAHDLDRKSPRLFRLDRMLEVRDTGEPRTAPVELDADAVSEEGAVRLVADGRPLEDAEVRYGPRVARWIRERHPEGRDLADGSFVVRHPILTDAWIVRRVLQYGPDAEILGPPRLRKAVLDALGVEVEAG
jgi:predicted DNA-binding transcriptional regulator YafY